MAEILRLDNLNRPPKARKRKKRVGRGRGSGHGKTSGRGHKGSRQHGGSKTYVGFSGGNIPLFRRLPKRGFRNPARKEYRVVNLGEIEKKFGENEEVNPKSLKEKGIIKNERIAIKILAKGEINKPLTFKINKFSKSAQEKIEKAGGKIEC